MVSDTSVLLHWAIAEPPFHKWRHFPVENSPFLQLLTQAESLQVSCTNVRCGEGGGGGVGVGTGVGRWGQKNRTLPRQRLSGSVYVVHPPVRLQFVLLNFSIRTIFGLG